MGITIDGDPPANGSQLPQQKIRWIGGFTVAPEDAPGVELKNPSGGVTAMEALQRRCAVSRTLLIKEQPIFVVLDDQVKMANDLRAVALAVRA